MPTPNKKISFVIPAYNCADTLEEAVCSIFNGNFEDGDEIIIVNDASTDNTAEVIKKLKFKHQIISQIDNKENKGCPASRNIGITAAKNLLIFNLDSDNVLAPDSIGKLKGLLLEKSADLAAFGEYHYFTKNIKNVTHKWICKPGTLTLADFLSGTINPGPGGNFLYTKRSWEKISGYWEYGKGLHEAWGFTLKQLANGSKFEVLQDSHYFHRHGSDSLFVRESKKDGESSIMAGKMITNFIELLDDRSLSLVQNQASSRIWFDNHSSWPLRLKNGENGVNGRKVSTKRDNQIKIMSKNILKFGILGKSKYQNIFERMFRLALKGMNYGEGSNPSDSGEIYVLNYLKNKYKGSKTPLTFFDVGANVGGYTSFILKIFADADARIFSFEPSKRTFEMLKESVSGNKHVFLFNFGFGKTNTELDLFSNGPGSGLASLHKRRIDHFGIKLNESEKVEIQTIDSFCSEQQIDHIDLLKLDIEGNELSALEGAKRMIELGKIDHIQFEFGGSNIDSRTYFQDFFYLLNPTHKIYRIIKDGLYPIDKYKETQEVFVTTNYLAVIRK